MYLIKQKPEPFICRYGKNQVTVKANIITSEKESKIVLFIPGFKKEEVSISVEDDILVVSGIVDAEHEKSYEYSQIEFRKEGFIRRFILPKSFNKDLIRAKVENGILEIVIPKNVESKQLKNISIQ